MYTQGTDFLTTGATTTNYSTQQYQYQYQYQLPTTQTTTTTTKQVTTTQPITYTQQFTTSQPDYSQAFTQQQTYTTSAVSDAFTTSALPQTYTTSATTSIPTTFSTTATTTSIPTYTTTQTTAIPTYTTTQTSAIPGFSTGFVKPRPAVQILRQGSGISPNEQNGIVSTAMAVYQSGITPISNNTASRIKKTLGGDWLVIVYTQGKPVDFNMTCVQGNDYMYFTLNEMAYQVCRLR